MEDEKRKHEKSKLSHPFFMINTITKMKFQLKFFDIRNVSLE